MKYITINEHGKVTGKYNKFDKNSIEVDDDFDCDFKIYDNGLWIDDLEELKAHHKFCLHDKIKNNFLKKQIDSDVKKIDKDIDDCTTKEEILNIYIEAD